MFLHVCFQSLIITMVFLLSRLVVCSPDLDLGELEILLAMSLSGDVCDLGATWYILLMDWKLSSIVVVSKRALCVLKLMCWKIFLISGLILRRFSCALSDFIYWTGFYQVLCVMYHRSFILFLTFIRPFSWINFTSKKKKSEQMW